MSKGLEARGALRRLGVKKEGEWSEKEDWRARPPWFGEKRSWLVELGLWRKEEVDGGRGWKEPRLVEWENQICEVEQEVKVGESACVVVVVEAKTAKSVKAATVKEDELFGRSTGYPTSRRPVDFRRELTTESWDVVSEWLAQSGITVGSTATKQANSSDAEEAQATAWLFYTWKDLFVEDLVAMPATDLVTHSIPTWSDAVPVRAKD